MLAVIVAASGFASQPRAVQRAGAYPDPSSIKTCADVASHRLCPGLFVPCERSCAGSGIDDEEGLTRLMATVLESVHNESARLAAMINASTAAVEAAALQRAWQDLTNSALEPEQEPVSSRSQRSATGSYLDLLYPNMQPSGPDLYCFPAGTTWRTAASTCLQLAGCVGFTFDANKITDVGAMALADGLCANNTLTILGIEGNPIGDAGTRAIADALANKGVTIHTDDTFSKAKIATDVSALIAAAREQDAGQQEAFLAAKNAVSAAPDAAAREELRRALADMYVGFSGGGTRDAIVESVMRSFEKASLTSDGQLDRLKALMGKCTDKYRTLTDRWAYLMNIEWIAPPGPVTQTVPFWYEALRGAPPAAKPQDMREWCRQAVDLDAAFNPFPGCDADEAYIRYLFVTAQWVNFKHQAIMRQLVKRFNAATFPAELGLDEEAWPLSLVNDHAVGEKAQHRAGPVKSRTGPRTRSRTTTPTGRRPPRRA